MKYAHVPLWKWILIIILVIALPLFFAFYRNVQLQQAISSMPPEPTAPPSPRHPPLP